MSPRTTLIASIATGVPGLGLAASGLLLLARTDALVMHGALLGGGPIEFPNLFPLLAVVVGVVLAVVALLLWLLRGRTIEAPRASAAAVNAPLIVARNGDEVTFFWGESRNVTRRRGTPRAALTQA